MAVSDQTVPFSLHDVFGPEVGRSDGPGIDLSRQVGPDNGQKNPFVLSTFQELGNKIRQMLPQDIEVVRARFSASPDTARVRGDTATVTFETDVPLPPPGGFRVRWDWGDGTSTSNLGLTAGTHFYGTPGDYTVTATLLSADGSRVLSVDTVYVKRESSPHWRLTSMQNPDELDLSVGIPLAVILQRAIASPASAMIAVDEAAGGSALSLRINNTGPWTARNCCGPIPLPAPNELRALLGVLPAIGAAATDRAFEGYTQSRWSESTSDLGAGSMTGQYATGSFQYEFRPPLGPAEPPIRRSGPEYVLRLTATRNGTAMTGVITFYYWAFEEATPTEPRGYFDRDATSASFPFTAVRIK